MQQDQPKKMMKYTKIISLIREFEVLLEIINKNIVKDSPNHAEKVKLLLI